MKFAKYLWEMLSRPATRTPLGLLLLIGFVVGIGAWLGFNGVLAKTNTTEFCIGCHEMQWPYEEYKQTIHYANRSGVRASCADCHVPQGDSVSGWFAKMQAKTLAAKDLYHHLLGTYDTKEKFEKGRWDMANAVWERMRARGSRECLNCHDFQAMDPEEQDRLAQKKHAQAVKKGNTCIDCHAGIAHKEPKEPKDEDGAKGDDKDQEDKGQEDEEDKG
ncbi:MAG: NapC/NirT family cytochrome c [Magnetococcales bacterium]|nr:NapC/NirT family cytochrome c [Magnetococcales bacterium]